MALPAKSPPRLPDLLEDLSEAATPLYGERYEILSLLGKGSYGTVYRARDTELDELVALKVLRRDLVHAPHILERFRSEVKLSRRVTHRNVARMFDIGEHQGERFLTMEFVDGRSLGQVILPAQGPPRLLPIERVAHIVREICSGLASAHAAGVIHRDLKPDNILLGRDGRVVITDFGVAHALKGPAGPVRDAGRTPSRPAAEFVGTPAYMAPEQANGEGQIDARTDLYALGVVLFELLTGTLPFGGDTAIAMIAARLFKPPPDPRTRRRDLPENLAKLVLRCMAQDAAARFPSAEAVAAALEPLLTVPGPPAAPPQPPPRRPSSEVATLPAPAFSAPAAPVITLTGSEPSGSLFAPTLAPQPASASRVKTVAVLPLRNQGAPEDAYLAEGVSEDLTDALSMIKEIRVRSRGAVYSALQAAAARPGAASGGIDARELGRTLDVHVIVEGSLRKSGANLRLSLRLSTIEDGVQIWAQRFDCAVTDVLTVADQAAQAITRALAAEEPAAPREVMADPRVVELYLRARALYCRMEPAHVEQSAALFEQALAIRPDDPALLTGYAMSLVRLWFFGTQGSGERALQAALHAVKAAPQRGEPHLALAMVRLHEGDLVAAVLGARQALARAPALADAFELIGRVLIETGPLPEGIRCLERALALDPSLARSRFDLARAHCLAGDWDHADAVLGQEVVDERDRGVLWLHRARRLSWRSDPEKARSYLADPEMAAGRYPRARAVLQLVAGGPLATDTLLELWAPLSNPSQRSPRSQAVLFQMRAELTCYTRQAEAALLALAQSVELGQPDLMWIDRCPLLALIRGDARFAPLRNKVAARAARVQEALRRPLT